MKKLVNKLVNDVKENRNKYILKAIIVALMFKSATFHTDNILLIIIVSAAIVALVFSFVDSIWNILSKIYTRNI